MRASSSGTPTGVQAAHYPVDQHVGHVALIEHLELSSPAGRLRGGDDHPIHIACKQQVDLTLLRLSVFPPI
jgi:hypothetical protein